MAKTNGRKAKTKTRTRARTRTKTGTRARKAGVRKKAMARTSPPRKKALTVRELQAELQKAQTSLAYLLRQLKAVDDDFRIDIAPLGDGPTPGSCPQHVVGDDCKSLDKPTPGCPQFIVGDECVPLDKPTPGCPQFIVGDECGSKPGYWPTGTALITAVVLKKSIERAAVAIQAIAGLLRGADPKMKIGS